MAISTEFAAEERVDVRRAVPSRATRRRRRQRAGVLLPLLAWLIPVLLLLFWQIGSSLGFIPRTVLPSPGSVVASAVRLWEDGVLQQSLLVSLARVGAGFSIGALAGLALGTVVGLSRLGEALFDRTLQAVRAIPHLALVPLMILWFGVGEEPKIVLIALGTLFPVYLNTAAGIRSVDVRLIELGRSYGLGRLALLRTVVFPGAMPGILTGIRYALGVAWLTLVIAETIASRDGLGYLAQVAREQLRYDQLVLTILLYALAGLLADQIVRLAARFLLAWHPAFRGSARKTIPKGAKA
jgi:sulfonate transport system permease protein